MTTFSKITRHGQVTFPASIRRKLGVNEGDIVSMEIIDDDVVLIPKKLVDKSRAYYRPRKWRAGEIEAEKDIKAGRVTTFNTAIRLFRDLDS